MKDLATLREVLKDKTAEEGLAFFSDQKELVVRFSSSLGAEDQAITSIIANRKLNIEIVTLDTGRLFQETYDLLDITRVKYDITIASFSPQREAIETLVSNKGPNSFYLSVDNRKECCHIRKVEPLKRALKGASVWVTGIRSEQSANRQLMDSVEWDEQHQLIKYHPLFHWTQPQLDDFINKHRIPVNGLHQKGFPSIGCAPCTRAVEKGEDPRSGRWWWEGAAKECGLHEVKQ